GSRLDARDAAAARVARRRHRRAAGLAPPATERTPSRIVMRRLPPPSSLEKECIMQSISSWLRRLRWVLPTIGAVVFSHAAAAQTAICYNCPPEWADWAAQIRAIKEKTGVTV